MAWIPRQLMSKTLRNNIGWAQVIKQFITMVSGIDTKMQEEMDKGGREHHIMTEYSRWVQIMNEKFPDAAVLPWLMFTTGTRNTRVTGKYIYRFFCEGLRVVNRDLNTEWSQVLNEGISGKSKEELWARFCYRLYCKRNELEVEDTTPIDFDWKLEEKRKWVYVFKFMGPCCEVLELGESKCHEFLQNPKNLGKRDTSQSKRKAEGTTPPNPLPPFLLPCIHSINPRFVEEIHARGESETYTRSRRLCVRLQT